tara:strand:+ start:193 stop:327 length:135 start_codon:yes stop_codon:yes gene_type:complete
MKITKQELHEIIREETTNALNARQTKVVDENDVPPVPVAGDAQK